MNNGFEKNIDELVSLFNTKRYNITVYLQKNFIENVNYIKQSRLTVNFTHGGINR